MAIANPTTLGTSSSATDAASYTHSTTAVVPSDGFIIVCAAWGAAADRTGAMSGGGLTWATDHSQLFSGAIPWRFAVFSAQAPAGLASSTVLTLTLTGGNAFGAFITACYTTGVATAAAKDVSDGSGASTASWDTTATSTTVDETLVIGGSIHDGLQTSTATGGATELFDFQLAAESWAMTVTYKQLATIQSASLTGTWTGGASDSTSAFAAYKSGTPPVIAPDYSRFPKLKLQRQAFRT